MTEQRRSHYRIEYARESAPQIKLSGIDFDVLDLSEEGLRFSLGGFSGIKEGMSVSGSLTFKTGETHLIHATVKRVAEEKVSLLLKKPLPQTTIMAQQRYLINQKTKI